MKNGAVKFIQNLHFLVKPAWLNYADRIIIANIQCPLDLITRIEDRRALTERYKHITFAERSVHLCFLCLTFFPIKFGRVTLDNDFLNLTKLCSMSMCMGRARLNFVSRCDLPSCTYGPSREAQHLVFESI